MRRLHAVLILVLVLGLFAPNADADCGDGIREPDSELCDHGDANGTDGCCTLDCTVVDGDRDGVCNTEDPCVSPADGFVEATLVMRGFATPALDDAFQLTVTVAPPPVDPASSGFTVVLSNEFIGAFVHGAIPGAAGWRLGPRGGAFYRDRTGTFGGISRVKMKLRRDGMLTITVKGRRREYAGSTDIRPIQVAIAFSDTSAAAAACRETFLSPARCTFASTGNTLHCAPPPSQRRCPSDQDGRVRCDALNAAAAEETYFATRGSYYSGDCAGLPGFVASPGVVCVTAGSLGFSLATASPTASLACVYSSAPHPGDPNLVCS